MKFKDITIGMIINEIADKNNVGVIVGIKRTYSHKIYSHKIKEQTNDENPIVTVVKFVDEDLPRGIHPNNIEQFKG